MALEALYRDKDEFESAVEEGFRSLYSERNGQYELTGINGVKTQADIDRISEGLRKERDDHKKTRDELGQFKGVLGSWSSLKPEEIQQRIDGYEALELAANSAGKTTAEEVTKQVEARLKIHTAPLERQIQDFQTRISESEKTITDYQSRERQRAIHDAVRKAALTPKNGAPIIPESIDVALMLAERVFEVTEDGKVLTKDHSGVIPGLEPDMWLQEIQTTYSFLWPPSEGGGAKGSKGNGINMANNPWHKDNFNLTAQGQYIKQHGMEKAEQMAKMAGTTIGGLPAKK